MSGSQGRHPRTVTEKRPTHLTDRIYARLKQDIFDFRLLPGDRFSENEIAARMGASRTPVREALTRLHRDGYVEVRFRSGWQIKPFNFAHFEQLYDLRIVLEEAAIRRLCEDGTEHDFSDLCDAWLAPPGERVSASAAVARMDERFHERMVEAAGNDEMSRVHHDITERLRIIRRLDFTKAARVDQTYTEHSEVLGALLERKTDAATSLMRGHILSSRSAVRQITLHMLHNARGRR